MVQRGYHRGCKETPTYTTTTNKHKIEALLPLTVFDWHHLVPKPKTKEEKKAVATLCEYIAKALRSDFRPNGTTGKRTMVETVVDAYLRLGDSRHVYQATVGKAEFERLVYEDSQQEGQST